MCVCVVVCVCYSTVYSVDHFNTIGIEIKCLSRSKNMFPCKYGFYYDYVLEKSYVHLLLGYTMHIPEVCSSMFQSST